ncbi:MAG TPA: DUF4173 domain-containing protein [bacterium]|nr:DUF4173 domain-containing protein [bacterium]
MKKSFSPYYFVAFLISAIAIEILFLYKSLGISVLIFSVVAIILYEIGKALFAEENKLNPYHLLLIPILFFSAGYAARADEFVLGWNTFALVFLVPAYAIFSASPNFLRRFSGLEFFEGMVKSIAAPFDSLGAVLGRTFRFGKHSLNGKILLKVILGLVITIPVFSIVLSLLTSSDAIFANALDGIVELFIPDTFGELVGKILLASFLSGLMWFVLSGQIESKLLKESNFKIKFLDNISLDMIIPAILVYALDIIYLLFTIVQFGYLFGGEEFVKNNDVIYSEYAVNGFWEMITVVLINFMVLYFVQTRFSLKSLTAKLILVPAYVFTVFSSVVMLISSHSKLTLYESQYGFTKDRLIPHVFMIFVLAILLLSLLNLSFKDTIRRKVINIGTMVITVIFLMGLNLFSMETFIVKKNVEKFQTEESVVDLDVKYLTELGTEGFVESRKYKNSPWLNAYFHESELEGLIPFGLEDSFRSSYCGRNCFEDNIDLQVERSKARVEEGWQSWNYWHWELGK